MRRPGDATDRRHPSLTRRGRGGCRAGPGNRPVILIVSSRTTLSPVMETRVAQGESRQDLPARPRGGAQGTTGPIPGQTILNRNDSPWPIRAGGAEPADSRSRDRDRTSGETHLTGVV
jgi:hypothetical protein